MPLVVDKVSASYGKRKVLDCLSFSLAEKECFGLIGLNGIGKTTLVRSILGLRPAQGTITFFGEPNFLAHSRRHIVYLPEKFQPPPQLSGWEYLSIHLDYYGQRIERDLARSLASGLDLEPAALDRRIRTFSKGMGQKLGLLGTLLVDARLMILDEPMSGLDPRARALLKDRLIEARSTGRTVFFSSHILSDIEEICDRIAVLHTGRIIYLGKASEFLAEMKAPTLERAFLGALEAGETAHWYGE